MFITALGRILKSNALVKHNIKRIDRLFGNHHFQGSAIHNYRQMAQLITKTVSRPTISIDWSGLTPCGEFHFLRASCPVNGRAMTLFEQSYCESEYMKQSIRQSFLEKLKEVLPNDCHPIIITDAGFRCPCFKLILSLGWDFVGRVRNNTRYQVPQKKQWLPIKTLYSPAKQKTMLSFIVLPSQS